LNINLSHFKLFLLSKNLAKYQNGELINIIRGKKGEWPCKLASLDDTRLVAGFTSEEEQLGKTIRILNWKTGGENRKLIGHTIVVTALEKLDDVHLASGSYDLK
jgi:hypothetical protein